jgi:hypothetical protein
MFHGRGIEIKLMRVVLFVPPERPAKGQPCKRLNA